MPASSPPEQLGIRSKTSMSWATLLADATELSDGSKANQSSLIHSIFLTRGASATLGSSSCRANASMSSIFTCMLRGPTVSMPPSLSQASMGSGTRAQIRPNMSTCLAQLWRRMAWMKASWTSSALPLRNMRSKSLAWASSTATGSTTSLGPPPKSPAPAPAGGKGGGPGPLEPPARPPTLQRRSSSRVSCRKAWTCAVRSRIRVCKGCTTSACTVPASSSSSDSVKRPETADAAAALVATCLCCSITRSTCFNSSATTGARSRPKRCAACSCSAAIPSKQSPMRSRKDDIISPTRWPMSGASSCSKWARNSVLKTGARDSCMASSKAVPTVSCN
mmetsp:Transcript_57794/g.130653  ORF Transcript_57794/g.130653 Transcript_57794/m.130653 type:complete len:335 (-) Transcript_57794:808-1812(-)